MFTIQYTDNPKVVLDVASAILNSDPLRNNIILSLLIDRISLSRTGRYWILKKEDEVVGVAAQSPLEYCLNISCISKTGVKYLSDYFVENELHFKCISGCESCVTEFLKNYNQKWQNAVEYSQKLLLYSLENQPANISCHGYLKQLKKIEHKNLILNLLKSFYEEIGEDLLDIMEIEQRIIDGRYYLWYNADNQLTSFICISNIFSENYIRLQNIYTISEHRGKGHAYEFVISLVRQMRSSQMNMVLFTNQFYLPSNTLFQKVGFKIIDKFVTITLKRNG